MKLHAIRHVYSVFLDRLQTIDIFGQPIQLFLKRDETHKTIFGAFITLICVFLSVSAFMIIGKELIER